LLDEVGDHRDGNIFAVIRLDSPDDQWDPRERHPHMIPPKPAMKQVAKHTRKATHDATTIENDQGLGIVGFDETDCSSCPPEAIK
jgi:hypothetical protein